MGQLVYILGRSGTGKSYSMRNLDPAKFAVINVQGKWFPFKNASKIKYVVTDDSDSIVKNIKGLATTYNIIVVDDFQYVMANEFMRRAMERGFDKFTEIGRHAWDIANCVRDLPAETIVYVMCHTDTDQEGLERLKTIGKLLDEKIVMEGMSTIVLKTNVSDGKYTFLTQNNGKDTAKSPAGMFPSYAIDNDLKYVDDKIRSYYGFEGSKSEAEMVQADTEAMREGPTTEKKTRRRRSAESPTVEKSAVAEVDKGTGAIVGDQVESAETEEDPKSIEELTPTRRRRRALKKEADQERKEIADEIAANVPDGDEEEVSYEETEEPEVIRNLKRKDRSQEESATTVTDQSEEAPVRRRRRRV